MTRKRYKVYLPKTVRWMILPLFLLVWGILTYATFSPSSGPDRPDLMAWVFASAVLLVVGTFIWMKTSGRWPVYILEVEEDEDSN
jgi:hypothetical protein